MDRHSSSMRFMQETKRRQHALFTELQTLGKAQANTMAPISYLAFKRANPSPPPGFPSTVRTGFLSDLSDDVIDGLSDVGAQTPPAAELEMFHLHGAVTRVPFANTAFPLRRSGFDCFAAAAWLADSQRERVVTWVHRFWDVLRPHASGAYVNMLDEGEDE